MGEVGNGQSVYHSKKCGCETLSGTRCKRRTARDGKCWYHGIMENGLRIDKASNPALGLGLFARLDPKRVHRGVKIFDKDEDICLYKGEILTDREIERKYPGDVDSAYCINLRNEGVNKNGERYPSKNIDASKTTSCWCRYANAARDNNAKLGGVYRDNDYIKLKAIKNIYDGEEITARYNRDERWNETISMAQGQS